MNLHQSLGTEIIFQSSLHKEFLPEEWKIANIIPIFSKKGNHTQTCNYHSVSLTLILATYMQ